jgi:heptose I phosphotransferase
MPKFEFEHWDEGRVHINASHAEVVRQAGLTTFEAWLKLADGEIVRQVGSRTTRRVVLTRGPRQETLYVKQFGRWSFRDAWRSWTRLSRAIHGARNEWDAILRFHRLGIPTVYPIAWGEWMGRSFVATRALDQRQNLLEVIEEWPGETTTGEEFRRRLVVEMARISRRMHGCGQFHQDFYLNHVLVSEDRRAPRPHLIDLGRVQQVRTFRQRWLLKDLSQLNYSARGLPCATRLRFLRLYLGRPFRPADRAWVRWIVLKSERIAAHTRKHSL